MKLKAEVGHWSSVVGNSVHLIAPDGRMVGQIAFLCHDDTLRDKDVQADLASVICDAINAPATNPAARDREALIEVLTARATAAEAALAAAMAGAVRVKPLEWMGTYDDRGDGTAEHNGGYEAETPFGIYEISMGCGPDGYYWSVSDEAGNEVASDDDIETAQTSGQSDVARRILAALEPNPAAQDREAALIAATFEKAVDAVHQECWTDGWAEGAEADIVRAEQATTTLAIMAIRALATQPQIDALEAVRREARAEGMRMAADLFTGSDLWEEAGIRGWIISAVQTAADSVLPPDRFNEGTSAAYEAVSDAAREDR